MKDEQSRFINVPLVDLKTNTSNSFCILWQKQPTVFPAIPSFECQ